MLERRKAASMRSAMTMEDDFDDATIATIAMRGAVVAFVF